MLNVITQLAVEGVFAKGYPLPGDSRAERWQAEMLVIRDRWGAAVASEDWSRSHFVPLDWFDPRHETPSEWGEFPDI